MPILKIPVAGLVAGLLCAVSGQLTAQQAVVTPLMTKELADMPGKEALMLLVEYPPGSSDPVHRHNADAFVYVLEGSVEMQVKRTPPGPRPQNGSMRQNRRRSVEEIVR